MSLPSSSASVRLRLGDCVLVVSFRQRWPRGTNSGSKDPVNEIDEALVLHVDPLDLQHEGRVPRDQLGVGLLGRHHGQHAQGLVGLLLQIDGALPEYDCARQGDKQAKTRKSVTNRRRAAHNISKQQAENQACDDVFPGAE